MVLAEPLEREAELKQLSALLVAARSGHGQVCVIEGPSGVGVDRPDAEEHRPTIRDDGPLSRSGGDTVIRIPIEAGGSRCVELWPEERDLREWPLHSPNSSLVDRTRGQR